MWLAAVCVTGCGSATLLQDGGTGGGSGGGTAGHGGAAGHAPTGSGGAGGSVATGGNGGGAGGAAGKSGAGQDGGPDAGPGKKSNGAGCGAGSECTSTYCVDSVCCESACSGQCEACAETNTKGQCTAVASGIPRGTRTACAGTGTCQGACTGASRTACTLPDTTVSCRAASCSSNVATLAAACDGQGACPTAETVACLPNTCAGTICSGGCSTTQPCQGNNYCRAGVCTPKQANGATCTTTDQCSTGNCVDGVCCDTACTGSCQACNLTATSGTCSPVKSATDDTCSGSNSCDATGVCKKVSGQTCSAAGDCVSGNCVDGHCCGSSSCGSCQSCTGGGGTCVQVISADDDSCNGTQSCDASGTCRKKTGQTCSANSDCLSAFCVDGVCCNSACNGQCQMCNLSGSAGTCSFTSGAPRSGQPCAGSGTCAGTCGGSSASCVYPGGSMSCGQPVCSNGTAMATGTCNGSGTCSAGATTPCGSFACSTDACYTSCTSQAQCAANTICSGGACTACSSGQTICGNSCVTLASDGNNCGSCGHSCYGGACSGSKCQPVSVYSSTSSNYSFALGSNRVYVVVPSSTGTAISYMPTNAPPGTALTPFSTVSGQSCGFLNPDPTTGDLFMQCYPVDSSGVPNQTLQYFRVVSATAGGAGTQLFQVGANQLGGIAPYPTGTGLVVWGEIDMSQVVRVAHTDGSMIGNLFTYPSGTTLNSVTGADQTSAYAWMTSGSGNILTQVSLTAGTSTTLVNNFSFSGTVLSDNSSVFWYIGNQGIYSVPKNMTTPAQATVMTDPTLAVFGAVDTSSVYYATEVDTVTGATGCSSYRVAHRPKTGGTEVSMVDGTQNCVSALKGDANVIAYSTHGLACATTTCTYALLKVAK